MSKRMPIGIEDFAKLRKNNYYFVDKTDFIRRLIDNHSEVTLFTRPRRFGKTLMLSMVDWFFSSQLPATKVASLREPLRHLNLLR